MNLAKQTGITPAVCWATGCTIGNIVFSSDEVFGSLISTLGNTAVLSCNIVPCGKFRNGAERWYCKTHQTHWGKKVDLAAVSTSAELKCSNHLMEMNYVAEPLVIEFNNVNEIGMWCALPAAMSSKAIEIRQPKIHVYQRFSDADTPVLDQARDAIICSFTEQLGIFPNHKITQIHITPPAAFEFVKSIEEGRPMDYVTCKKCGYPHLDLGRFAITAHAKHFCGNCGNDNIWSNTKLVSTPLKPLYDRFNNSKEYIVPKRSLNLDDYQGYDFDIWPSIPAILWTADKAQEKGIYVHVYEKGHRVIANTFGSVIYQGKALDRSDLWRLMTENTRY